ncbi:MAG: Dabb family protein [Spirochaetaceae bacterium]|nr:Dabb family protein [Spirochaetaceae bacterium]
MVTSVILFKLKEKNDENIVRIREKLLGMQGKIPELKSITVKNNVRSSPTGFDAVMIAVYDSIKDFEAYAVHPVHVEAGNFILKLCEQTASALYED